MASLQSATVGALHGLTTSPGMVVLTSSTGIITHASGTAPTVQ